MARKLWTVIIQTEAEDFLNRNMSTKKSTKQEKKDLKIEVLQKISSLATAGFGLVAALAWNDAIKAIFAQVFPAPAENIAAKGGHILPRRVGADSQRGSHPIGANFP